LFLENPERIAEAYGFRLTKGDHEILTTVFTNLGAEDMKNLVKAFEALENEVYKRLAQPETLAAVPLDSAAVLPPKRCMKPCALSIWPPPVIREELNARGLQPAA
jgi:hypothetical protein